MTNTVKSVWLLAVVAAWQVLPDAYIGPLNAWNPHALMEFVLIILAIEWLGQTSVRLIGADYGLLLTGLMSGFASSTATIHIMGEVAKTHPALTHRAAIAAVLSNLATLFQLALLIFVLAPALLPLLLPALFFGVMTMSGYAIVTIRKNAASSVFASKDWRSADSTHWKGLVVLVVTVCTVSLTAAFLQSTFGENGLLAGAAVAGLVDAHAIVPTIASLLTQQHISVAEGVMPVLLGFTTNALSKSLIAYQSGGLAYAKTVWAGVWLTTGFVWVGYWAQRF